jgi:signal transduction histidine kinase
VASLLGPAEVAILNRELEDERRRIAQALHDDVIQSLFAATLGLESVRRSLSDPEQQDKVSDCCDIVERAIGGIRAHIAGTLGSAPTTERLTARVQQVAADFIVDRGPHIAVRCDDFVDALTDGELLEDACSVVREGVANAVRHSFASRIEVWVEYRDGMLVVEVSDDGVGLRASSRASGTANLRHRAEARGGWLRFAVAPKSGCTLVWSVPARRTTDTGDD